MVTMAGPMSSFRSGLGGALTLLLVCGVLPVHAQEVNRDSFAQVRSETDVDDRAAVRAARLRLERSDPLFWKQPWPAGRFRAALARSLTPVEAGAQLDQASGDPDMIKDCAANLAGRDDIGALLLEKDRVAALIAAHISSAVRIAEDDLYDGRRGLATRLLSDPSSAERAVESFVVGTTPDGIRLVADVLAGTVELPAPALAALARARPINFNPRRPKPLGAERLAALLAAQPNLEDHLLRVLAAQIVELSSDADADTIASAWQGARSVDADIDDWGRIGRDHGAAVTIAKLPSAAVLPVVQGAYWAGLISAERSFADADESAAWVAGGYTSTPDARVRGALLLRLPDLHGYLVADERRKHAVPAWREFLEMLAAGREADPPVLRLLGQRTGRALLNDLSDDPSRRWRMRGPALPVAKKDELGTSAIGRARALVAAADDPAKLLEQIETAQLESHEPDLHSMIRAEPALDADTCVALRKLVEQCQDPRGVRLAASLLGVGGDLDDMAFVIRRADGLDLDGDYDGYWLPPGGRLVITTEALRRTLELVEEKTISPLARFDLMERVVLALDFALDDGPPPETLAVLGTWLACIIHHATPGT